MINTNEKYKNKLIILKTRILILEIIGIAIILTASVFIGNNLGRLLAAIQNPENIIANLDDINFYELPTTLYDINGEKISEFFIHKREIIPFYKIPKQLINILIALEDQNFYTHGGIDPYSVFRALVHNTKESIKNKKLTINQGGSTLSQQIAKLLFTKRQRTIKRKFIELWKTIQIEKRYSKNEIIEKYFNQIYFGHGVYGIAIASDFFFGKDIRKINTTEAALLISIPPAPNLFSPFKNHKKAKIRHKIIIDKIITLGIITKEKAREEYKELWGKLRKKIINKHYQTALGNRIDKAPYFSEYIRVSLEKTLRKELEDAIEKEIVSQNKNIKKETLNKNIESKIRKILFTGGFKIYTTLDLNTQRIAQKLVKKRLAMQDEIFHKENKKLYKKIQKRYSNLFQFIGINLFTKHSFDFQNTSKQKELLKQIDNKAKLINIIAKTFSLSSIDKIMLKHNSIINEEELGMKTEAALISIEPKTGQIKAMLGGRRFSPKNRLNRVFSKRQPGSAFKSLVYGAAINSKKFYPNTIVSDKPISIQDKDEVWSPQNHNKTFIGPVSIRKALALSINTVAVRIVEQLSPKYIIDFSAPLLGMKKEEFGENISIALGTNEVSPIEMCRAMAVYANGGLNIEPSAILRIKDRNGNLIRDFTKQNKTKKRLISKKLAETMTNMLQDVINKGTGRKARTIGKLTMAASGKTGTSQNSKDAWFAGFTKELATVVWIGFDKDLSLGEKQFGGNSAAPLWGQFMKEAVENKKSVPKM